MPDLVQGELPINFRFMVSLPHSVLSTAGLLCAAPRFEGLSERLHDMRSSLAPGLRDELCLLMGFTGGYQRFGEQIMAHLPAEAERMDFEQLVAHLEATPDIHYQWMALRALARGTGDRPTPAELFELAGMPDKWVEYLQATDSQAEPAVVSSLIADGAVLKRRLVSALEGFWTAGYDQEFEATRPLMARSVEHHLSRRLPAAFRDAFVAVTGRLVPERIAALQSSVSAVRFVPSCYVGPYVAYSHYDEELVVFYNCLNAPARPQVSDGTALYPPLKALADETRLQIVTMLQGQEMYAQEIVDRLAISQPAVSRHLNLMVTAGVLKIRREGNAKYYSVDRDTLSRVADALGRLV